MLVEGKHTCEKCSRTFEWFHMFTDPTNRVSVSRFPDNKQGIRKAVKLPSGNYSMSVYCPFCDHMNYFEYVREH